MKTLLWLDDSRNPFINLFIETFSPIPHEKLNHVEWVKNYDEFVKWITENGLPTAICFDHDLGLLTQLKHRESGTSKRASRKLAKQTEKTGYDAAKWLVDYCIDNSCKLPLYNIQSQNPVGKENIKCLLENYKKHCEK